MGLTIHYSLHSDAASAAEAREAVERLRRAALDLPFAEVGDVVELTGDAIRAENADDDRLKWLLVQASRWVFDQTAVAQVIPTHVVAFRTWPGPGCEVANFGLCRYPATVEIAGKSVATDLDGWSWQSFCKTQFASNPKDGGIENFLRCHLVVVELLDHARQLNLLAEVKDESGFWEDRDVVDLAETVGQWNRNMAAFVGHWKDWLGDDFVAPIRDYPDFEHLEAEGRDDSASE